MMRLVTGLLCAGVMLASAWPATAQDKQKAMMRVHLPAPRTELVIQGVEIKPTDADVRLFESPLLEVGKSFVYDIEAKWTENGKPMTRKRSVKVMAGQTTEVDLRKGDENTPAPVKPMIDKPADKPADKPIEKPADKPADKPIEKPADKPPVSPTIDKPVDKPSVKPMADKPAEKPVEKPADKPPEPIIGTPQEVVDTMLKMAKVHDGDVVCVIGVRDGLVPLTAVTKFKAARAIGLEENPVHLAWARGASTTAGPKVEFRKTDFAKLTEPDLADANVVVLDSTPLTQKHLKAISAVLKKLKPDTRIVSHEHAVADLRDDDYREQTVNNLDHAIHLYVIK
jgi:uncharacterized protein (TIGR03000 family)